MMNAPVQHFPSQKPDTPSEFAFPRVSKDRLAKIPGRKGLPVLGVLPEAVRNPFAFSKAMYERYGPIHRFYACGNWNVQLVGPEANEFVLFDRDGNFSAVGGWQPVFGKHFSGGLLLRDGEDHRWHRKLIATAFKQDQLQSYLSTFSRNIAELTPDRSTLTLEAYEFAQQLTFANGYAAFLGRDAEQATRSDLLAFRYMMRSATAVLPWALPGTAHARATWAKRHIARLLEPLFETEVSADRTDLAAVLVRMHHDGLLTRREVLAHLTFTIAASFDALSSGTVSTLHYLSRDLNSQRHVREELCGAIASPASITLGELQACPKSDWALKEALRLNAAAPVLWRRALRDVEFGGHVLPAGTVVGVNPMLTHLLPDLWPDPSHYDPGRFAPEPSGLRHRFAYVPFGGGAHGCLGANFASLQVRALLRVLLERFEIKPADDSPQQWYHWPNCRPLGGMQLSLRAL